MEKTITTKIKKYRIKQRKVKTDWTRQPIQKRSWKWIVKGFQNDAQDYCEATTLHGFRYITSDEAKCVAKFLWLTVCLLSSTLSIYLMLRVWGKYTMTPAVISVETTTHPLWEFLFPAVSICNFNKVYKPRADAMAEKMRIYGMNNSEIQAFFDELPSMIHNKFSMRDFHRGMATLARIGLGPASYMYTLMQPCNKLLSKCSWQGVRYRCSEIFKTVKTSHGYCCAFNYHVLHGEFPFEGHAALSLGNPTNTSALPGMAHPLLIPGSGRDFGLFVLINVESDAYRASTRDYSGAAVLIHDPLVYPEINLQAVNTQPGQEVIVSVKGSVIEGEENLRSLSLEQRKCFFDDEVQLNTSSHYRYGACITECRMEYIHAQCGCVPFYYPSTMERVRSCGLMDLECLRDHGSTLALLEASSSDVKAANLNLPQQRAKCRRDCLPQCTDKSYTLTSSSAWFMAEEAFRKSHISNKHFFESSNESALTVYFPDITCLKYRRETVMTWENLFAAFGGIFGLCIGGSFVSLVEIVYFLTIRIFRIEKIENPEKPGIFHNREVTGSIENQSHVDTKQSDIGWENNDFLKRFNSHKSAQLRSRAFLNFPKSDTNGMAFKIDFAGYPPANSFMTN